MRGIRDGHGLHLMGSILAAADRGARIENNILAFEPSDLRGQLRRGKEANLIVFVVDASGSMSARDRLSAVTGAVQSLLVDAYQRRDKVTVISVRGTQPELILPPTGSIDIAMKRLADVRTGGRTPLGEGLLMAQELVDRELRREPGRRPLLVVLSDGRATSSSGLAGVQQAANAIALRGVMTSVVIDCESGRTRLGLAVSLAQQLGGTCLQLTELNAESVVSSIQVF
ncbi:vWA domain-containing protein [Corynebacterium epidermidicanis]|uniref:Mg-chelatase subunit ChlD n=1 Tax=Corynebacterium epidermidicanis TaxID=1050174 RepID=A0A0G3GQG8_9CORY|nr:Mg-chelatase subunit ChlD [Corynebacterium epidermidicanis]